MNQRTLGIAQQIIDATTYGSEPEPLRELIRKDWRMRGGDNGAHMVLITALMNEVIRNRYAAQTQDRQIYFLEQRLERLERSFVARIKERFNSIRYAISRY